MIELRSASDDLRKGRFETCPDLQAKMQEYRENGVRLGWLIDPDNCQVEIYRPAQGVEVQASPQSLSGEDVLPGFVLDLSEIF